VLATGGVNASVTLCVLLLPAVLLVFAGNTRRAWALRGWWVTAVVLATAWWVLALAVQARYGLNFLPYTETAQTTTVDRFRRRDDPRHHRLDDLPAPAVAVAPGGGRLRVGAGRRPGFRVGRRPRPARPGPPRPAGPAVPARRGRAGFVAVAAAYPGHPGGLFADGVRELLTSPFGFLRNVYKFQPVVRVPLALGFAHALTVAASALSKPRVSASARYAAACVTIGAIAGGMLPVLGGRVLPQGTFDEVPGYWVQAADWLAGNPSGGRTLVLPGTAFRRVQVGADAG
jgi:arabinofuranan 3-O-arabinosyltransferase